MKKILLIVLLANIGLFYLTPPLAEAQDAYSTRAGDYAKSGISEQIKKYLCAPTNAKNDSTGTNSAQNDLYLCINKMYRLAIIGGSVIAVFFIVIGGYIYMSAEGNQESVDKAKNILVSSLTGLVILFGGYVLLRAINPDLVKFQNIQPTSVKLDTTGWDQYPKTSLDSQGKLLSVSGGAGHKAEELKAAHCAFQTAKQQNEVPNMTEKLFQATKNICTKVYQPTNSDPQISSVIGYNGHATNSWHYKGYAVDFAGNNNNFVNTAVGKALIENAKSAGFDRINPGTDETATNHVHLDLANSCAVK